MQDSPIFLPLREQRARLRAGTLTATALAEASISAYQQRGQHDHAYLTWNGERALAMAKAADAVLAQGGDAGALMGMTVSIKDIYAVTGLPTYAGSSQRLPKRWERPGPVVSTLLKQLPSVMGKTTPLSLPLAAWAPMPIGEHHATPGMHISTARLAAQAPGRVFHWWAVRQVWH